MYTHLFFELQVIGDTIREQTDQQVVDADELWPVSDGECIALYLPFLVLLLVVGDHPFHLSHFFHSCPFPYAEHPVQAYKEVARFMELQRTREPFKLRRVCIIEYRIERVCPCSFELTTATQHTSHVCSFLYIVFCSHLWMEATFVELEHQDGHSIS